MKKTVLIFLMTLCFVMTNAQTKIYLKAGDKIATATLVDNDATRALVALLEQSAITVNMDDYGGFEKVGSLPQSLPTSNSQISTVPGDIMLYQGNQIVIFYGTNSWSYTRLGKFDNAGAQSVKEFLGKGSIQLTLSLVAESGLEEIVAENEHIDKVYNLKGQIVTTRPLPQGIYIVNGQKCIIK